MDNILEIDGSYLEGGGQILRIALCMSALEKIPVRIKNIRAGRSKPGLLEQHLKGVELVGKLSQAEVKGAFFGSVCVEFFPKKLTGGHFNALVKTAGSITLLLQAALPCCIYADTETELELHGGTNTEMAPQVDYMTEVYRPNLEKFGATFDFDLIKRGYFPKGGGKVSVNIKPVNHLDPVTLLDQGHIRSIYGWSYVAGSLPLGIAHDMAASATNELKKVHNDVNIEVYKEDRNIAPDNAAGIVLVAETTTGCVLGSSSLIRTRSRIGSKESYEAGTNAATPLIKSLNSGACVDEFCQDQIIILMALADGTSKVRAGEITDHTKTAIHVVEKFTNKCKFNIIPDGKTNIIECIK